MVSNSSATRILRKLGASLIILLSFTTALFAQKDSGDRPTKRMPWILVHAPELDANKDGVVEFESELMAEANSVFAAYDKSGDGRITPDESGARGVPKSPLGGFVRQHAKELDRNNDGGISKEELTGLFAKFFKEGRSQWGSSINRRRVSRRRRATPAASA